MEIKTRNTNTLMSQVYGRLVSGNGVIAQPSRNGPVLRFAEPVSVCILKPWERVNFSATRDANPFFHLMEALAMLVPFNSVKFMVHFARNMASFSDDGQTYNAFYGTRARSWTGGTADTVDQIWCIIDTLSKDPTSRQALVNLWDVRDLQKQTKDKACNLSMLFDIKNEELCMTSFNRSNDAILGAVSGANVVHLSLFQEYVACALGRPMGPWWHISNNLHVYVEHPKWEPLAMEAAADTLYGHPYDTDATNCQVLFVQEGKAVFDHDVVVFISMAFKAITTGAAVTFGFSNRFIETVAKPMFNSWQLHKAHNVDGAIMAARHIEADDWRLACTLWLQRRSGNRKPEHSTPPVNA